MKIVLDTNCLLVSLPQNSQYRCLWDAFRQGKYTSCDPDDNKFVDCAVSANADYIVTNDRHFNVLKGIYFPQVNVIDIDTFKRLLIR